MTPRPRAATHRLTATTCLLIGLVALAACSPTPPGGGRTPVDPLATFHEQELTFAPCPDEPVNAGLPPAECAVLQVPLSYDDPTGEAIGVAVSRVSATGDDPIGSVIVNPGGPGSSALSFGPVVAGSWGHRPLRESLDVVAMDPRGVGASQPAIDCYPDVERESDAVVSGIPAGALSWTEESAGEVVEQCAESVGGEHALAQMGTRNVVHDLDVLRAALGDEQLTFLGASYGTRLGATYAQTYPDKVRALVLDGAIDPGADTSQRQLQLFSGLQRSFEQLAASCARSTDCPLGTDPAAASSAAQTLLRPLLDEPLPTGEGRELTYFAAVEAVVAGLYSSEVWPLVVAGLADLAQGNGQTLLALRDASAGRGPEGAYSDSVEATLTINCLDEVHLTPREATDLVAQINDAAPFLDPGRPVATHDGCASWPSTSTLDFPPSIDTDALPTTMVVSVTGDGLTPHEGGIALADLLHASLLTVEGEQHGATTVGNACVDDAVENYLLTLQAPAHGSRCTL